MTSPIAAMRSQHPVGSGTRDDAFQPPQPQWKVLQIYRDQNKQQRAFITAKEKEEPEVGSSLQLHAGGGGSAQHPPRIKLMLDGDND